MADVIISNHGTVFGIQPLTVVAEGWIEDNVHTENWQWVGPTLMVDHHFIVDLVSGMRLDGLEVT